MLKLSFMCAVQRSILDKLPETTFLQTGFSLSNSYHKDNWVCIYRGYIEG